MYISKIKLHNIRGFGANFVLDITTPLDDRPRLRTVIIGQNGTCKTTLLRCIALSICWKEDANALMAEPIGPMISQGRRQGSIEVELQDRSRKGQRITIVNQLSRDKGRRDRFVDDQVGREKLARKLPIFICAVGAGRSGEGVDPYRDYQVVDSVYSLFNYEQSSLIPVELALRRLQKFRVKKKSVYGKIIGCIKNALNLSRSAKLEVGEAGGVFITAPGIGQKIPFEAWADGYRLTTNWILDIYGWAMRANAVTSDGGVRGIILIDEIEQHIHPSMQMGLLKVLSEALPEAQIFVTTHSPLTALGANPNELAVLRKTPSGVKLVDSPPDFSGFSALDMLTDDRLFGTEGFRPEISEEFQRYFRLSKKRKSSRTKEDSRQLFQTSRKLMDTELSKEPESPLLKELNSLLRKHEL